MRLPAIPFGILAYSIVSFAAKQEVLAEGSEVIQRCCEHAYRRFPSLVKFSAHETFQSPKYYSLQQVGMKPHCHFTPLNTQHVSAIVSIAHDHACPFAVRSGGGMFWPGSSNIDKGLLIDLGHLRGIEVDHERNVARLGPSLLWGEVYTTLSSLNLYVAGGRLPVVGVGGFLMHGGISFSSFEHGFASETVVNYEVVLADGSIVNANATSYPDLFWALKWGSTNYGIVTRLDLSTYTLPPKFWAGMVVYHELPDTVQKTLFDDWLKYIDKHSYDKKVFSMVSYEKGTKITGTILANLDGEPIPRFIPPEVATPMIESTRELPFHEFVDSLMIVVGTEPKRVAWYPITTKPNADMLLDFRKRAYEICGTLEDHVKGFQCIIVIQPFTKGFIGANPESAAYDVLHEPDDNLILSLLELHWDSSEDDEEVNKAIADIRAWTESTTKERGVYNAFIYPNYADGTHDFYGNSLSKRSLAKMLKVKQKYDPEDVFGRLWKGGFKLPKSKVQHNTEHDRDEL
ncbi:hypothetical protein V5O48_008328 [Marasmius crinis-equi]|uniref:FAD-binding PCMH-type domain-containing protein n=1 Tax=Marasmius crinis-equi TaxID=585013 RepID=A0ABR3FE95_9AGAR